MSQTKVVVSWSSGKESALTLYKLLQTKNISVAGLLTTVTQDYERVSMHGVREESLEQQAEELNLPLYKVKIPKECSMKIYQNKMREAVSMLEKQAVSHIAFGDIFLEDIKRYRENQLASTTITPLFPLWQRCSKNIAEEFIDVGFKAIVTCVDTAKICSDFAGREYNHDFISSLPANVDPCGENGEFHSFVYDAPIFRNSICVEKGETVNRNGFFFVDLKKK